MSNGHDEQARQRLQERFQALDTEEWSEQGKAQQRGLQFEGLVQDLFEACGILTRRSYRTGEVEEQVDGAVAFGGRHALLESKWVESGLAASELFAFLGKVEGKFTGTVGLFVSRKPLLESFVKALRWGRRQSVMVVHGEDVDHLFEPNFPVKEYLEMHLLHLSLDNYSHLPTAKFLSGRDIQQVQAPPPPEALPDPIGDLIQRCANEPAAKNLVREFARGLNEEQRVTATVRLLAKNLYLTIVDSQSREDAWRGQNLEAFLRELVGRLPSALTDADRLYFIDRLSPDFEGSYYRRLAALFAPRLRYLTDAEQAQFEIRLTEQWETAFYDYHAENRMAEVTSELWPFLSAPTRRELLRYAVRILLSDRRPQFPQYRLALQVLRTEFQSPETQTEIEDVFAKIVRESARTWVKAGWTDAEGREFVVRFLADANRQISPFLPDYEARIEAIVTEEHQAAAQHLAPQ